MNVVIVDDTHINLVLMSRLIGKLDGVQTVTFQAARPALDWCNSAPWDLLIIDYMMPDMDGLELIARLQGDPRERPPVLMVTSSMDVEVRHRALENGASDFLIKPIDKVEFLARTRNMLQLRRATVGLQHRASWLADEVAKATLELRSREQETIMLLARASEYRDPETGAHILRMAHYSRLIADQLGLPLQEQDDIFNAAPMHDVGKVGTPDQILLKPGRLTDDEMAIMRQHAQIGYDILKSSQARMLQLAATIALTHHERYDGGGYPNGLRGDGIALAGRIVAVADVFDALTSRRPYKRAWSMDAARQYLLDHSGSHFDPHCVAALLARWDEVQAVHARYQDPELEPGAEPSPQSGGA